MLPIKLTPRNNQEAYDNAVSHLYYMPRRSMDPENLLCVYRSQDGLSCVIGSMIPDEDYDPIIDDIMHFGAIDYLVYNKTIVLEDEVNVMLLKELQEIHDNERNWAIGGFTGLGVLRAIARQYSLSSSIIDAIYLQMKN